MRYIKLTLQYIYHNFVWVMLLSLLPGIVLGLATEPTSIFNFLLDFHAHAEAPSFGAVLASVSELKWLSVVIGIVVLPVFAVFLSAMCGIESRHMRLGIRDLKGFFKRVNNNILPVILIILSVLASLEIVAILFASFGYLWIAIVPSVNVALALTVICAALLMLLLLFFMSLCIMWLPTMSITGLNAKKALGTAISSLRGNISRVFMSITIPMIPVFGIMCLMSVYKFKFAWLINIVLYTLMVGYYVTLMYTAYCDINDVDREDLRDPYALPATSDKEEDSQ